MIELRRVSKTFVTTRGVTAALSGIDLFVERGELLCLVGPSGCGKTTLLNLIAGLDRADAGEVLVAGRAIAGPGPDRGVMFQDAALFPWLSVEQNVEFGLKEQRVPRAERRARAARYLARVGMLRFAKSFIHELSGGMRQRVALARALALECEILLMDEPFGALDARTRDGLQAELAEIWSATKKTIVFVTHDMAEAVCLGSRVVVLGARPARVQGVVDLEPLLARPRSAEDPDVIALATHLKHDLDETELHDRDRPEKAAAPVGGGRADPAAHSLDVPL